MSYTIAADVIRKGLDVLLENVEHPTDLSQDSARELLLSCTMPAGLLEGLWDLTQRFLDRGREGRQFNFLLSETPSHASFTNFSFSSAMRQFNMAFCA